MNRRLMALCFGVFILFSLFPLKSLSRGPYLFIGERNRETVFGRILNKEGEPIIARVELWYRTLGEIKEEGGNMTPKKDRYRRNLFHSGWSDEDGWYHLNGFPGEYTLRVTKGPEWEIFETPVTIRMIHRVIKNKETPELDGQRIDVSLNRLYNMKAHGWFGGDTHHHSFHSDGRNTPRQIYESALASGLSWTCLTDHNNTVQNEIWKSFRTEQFLPIPGVEITPNNLPKEELIKKGFGHHNYFGPDVGDKLFEPTDGKDPILWDRYYWDSHEQIQRAIDKTHQYNGLYQLNHPMSGRIWPNGTQSSWGKIKGWDAIEIWNGESPPHTPDLDLILYPENLFSMNTMGIQLWFEFLNAGNRVAGWGGSDSHDATGLVHGNKGPYSHRGVTGFPTTYVYSEELSWVDIRSGLKNANAFICAGSFGPLLLTSANFTKMVGNTVTPLSYKKMKEVIKNLKNKDDEFQYDEVITDYKALNDPKARYVYLNIRILGNRPLVAYENGVRIIKNGRVSGKFSTPDNVMTLKIQTVVKVTEKKDMWFIVEAFGKYPSVAITNPFFVDVDKDGHWGAKTWTFPKGADEWSNPWPKSPEITVPDGPARPWYDLPDSPVGFEKPIVIETYLNPDGTLKSDKKNQTE